MVDVDPGAVVPQTSRGGRASSGWALLAAGALIASALLQVQASLQRWVTAREGWTREDRWVEDHLFDYTIPADPWERIGTTAQVHGLGALLIAVALLVMARALSAGAVFRLTSIVVAAVFGLSGLHGVVSGLIGAPTPLQWPFLQMMLSLVPILGLGALAARSARRSLPTAFAYACLLGSTTPGLLVATFVIAPAITGFQSYDTTPWTETVVAATTGAAACAMLCAAGAFALRARSRRTRVATA
ncbi:hypothetical protein [Rathayibacter sp. VKM Ac-2760]|uniref:hypothetical protein n=1 Tax=Rathayibacter sp. VKM Ac-2760 TaxID=2609253 RepID=UPI001315D100|nr:hypothetical protein [Rathayibacter sp. VKM Ac-2760]QHC58860.1 hypothetical protein GSU72_10110 [Rathayibacter sp. VKM Ac-2760]